MFRDPADASNELYVSQRDITINAGSGSLTNADVDYDIAFSPINFSRASDYFENPHDNVHVRVGGRPFVGAPGWMSAVATSAQDPIFWLHHANMDRLWNLWLAQGGGRSSPINDADWRQRQFTFFDEDGQEVHMSGCEVLRASEQLNYRYEEEPTQINQSCPPSAVALSSWKNMKLFVPPWEPVTLGNDPVTVFIDIKDQAKQMAEIIQGKTRNLFLEVDGVEAERQPGVVWEVYLGGSETELKRGVESPFYIGSMALFASGIRSIVHHKFEPAHFAFPINRAIQSALDANQTRLPLTFVPTGLLIDGKPSRPEVASKVRIGGVSFVVETQE
jgi:tyrosinase